jgi:hypothetical protein
MTAGHYLATVRIAMNQGTKPADDANTNVVSAGQTDRILAAALASPEEDGA